MKDWEDKLGCKPRPIISQNMKGCELDEYNKHFLIKHVGEGVLE